MKFNSECFIGFDEINDLLRASIKEALLIFCIALHQP